MEVVVHHHRLVGVYGDLLVTGPTLKTVKNVLHGLQSGAVLLMVTPTVEPSTYFQR